MQKAGLRVGSVGHRQSPDTQGYSRIGTPTGTDSRRQCAIGFSLMEITCSRCHQAVDADSCYCATCGLPQLVYSSEPNTSQPQQDKWNDAMRDPSAVEWKPALRVATLLALPAGLLSSGLSPVGTLGLVWMSIAAGWTVMLYVRGQRPAWITTGSG